MEYLVQTVSQPDWARIPSIVLTHTDWLPACPIAASAQLCHDENRLFLRMEAVESSIRSTLRDPLASVCEDSCLEFFFAPQTDDTRYFNFEFNPLGTFFMGFGGSRETRCRLFPSAPEQFEITPFRTGIGWGFTCSIPLSFLRMFFPDCSFKGRAACNFYKCGEKTEIPHYLSWSPMTCSQPDFHRAEDFGQLIYE